MKKVSPRKRRFRVLEGERAAAKPATPAKDMHLRIMVEQMVRAGCSAEAIEDAVSRAA